MIDDVYDVLFKEVQNVMSLRFNFKIFLGDYFVIKKYSSWNTSQFNKKINKINRDDLFIYSKSWEIIWNQKLVIKKKSSKMTTKKEISPLAVGCTYI